MDTLPLLRSIPLFEGLTDDDLQALASALKPRTFRAGEMIFAQGDAGNAMYIVESGDVNIHLPGEASPSYLAGRSGARRILRRTSSVR
jgi:CRP-like cAMP-binding protein